MTAKEKAMELVEQFSLVGLQQREEGIACALIAVDEILLAIDWHEYEYPNEQFEYWHEVRTEIENL